MKHQMTKIPALLDKALLTKPTHTADKGKGKRKSDQPIITRGKARHEMIQKSAYALYEARNFTGGHELEDWLQAEAEVDKLLDQSDSSRIIPVS